MAVPYEFVKRLALAKRHFIAIISRRKYFKSIRKVLAQFVCIPLVILANFVHFLTKSSGNCVITVYFFTKHFKLIRQVAACVCRLDQLFFPKNVRNSKKIPLFLNVLYSAVANISNAFARWRYSVRF